MPALDRRHLPALAVAALVLLVLAVRLVPARGGDPVAISPPGAAAPGGADGADAGASVGGAAAGEDPAAGPAGGGAPDGAGARGELFVHVAGAVRQPGLYRLPRGARVAQAVELAGGPTRRAELAGVNLAAPVADGQQVVVPRRGEAPAGAGAGGAASGGGAGGAGGPAGAPISLATATLEQLDALDGIGPTLARRILEYREAHGGFRSVEELREVDGIGEKRFEALRRAVRP